MFRMNEKYLKSTLVIHWNLKDLSVEIRRCKRLSDGKSSEVTYHRLLPGQQLQFDEAMTKRVVTSFDCKRSPPPLARKGIEP